jgi:hypothetical protein
MKQSFTDEGTRHWEPVLHEITDATEVGTIDIDLGDGNNSNRSSDTDKGDEP